MEAADVIRIARSLDAVVAGTSAALHWRWQVKEAPRRPVMVVARNRSRVRHPEIDIRRADLPANWHRDNVLTPVATVLDCARTLPLADAVVVADSALRSNRVSRPALTASVGSVPRTGRSRATRVVSLADPRSMSAFESVARVIALDVAGLKLEPQGNIDSIGHGDLADVRLRIVVECDSWTHHSAAEVFRRDVRRYTRMTLAGWIVVRLVWEDVMRRPDRVREQLATAVELARSRTQFIR